MISVAEERPRGVCAHEAGHAVVAWSFGLPVAACCVVFSEAKGWHGGTDIPKGSEDRLHWTDKIVVLVAGRIAEKVFKCQAHGSAWAGDLGDIAALLCDNEIPQEEHWSRITEASERARTILETHRDKGQKLVERLFERGRVDADEFLRLMNG